MTGRGLVLYDGDCGFCSRWVRRWEPVLRRYGFATATLQSAAKRLGLPAEAALADIRVETPEGRIVSGTDAYLYVMKRIWWMLPLGLLFSLPGLHGLMELGYRWVARNRYCISAAGRVTRPPARPGRSG